MDCNNKSLYRWAIRRFIKKERGMTSVEFAISFSAFLIMLLFLLELCRFISLASTLDLSAAEAGRLASRNKLTNATYLEIFNKYLHDKNKTLMSFFFREATLKDLDVKIGYCSSISDINNNLCNDDAKRKIAVYRVNYRYSSLFLPIPTRFFEDININHHVIYVQEHATG